MKKKIHVFWPRSPVPGNLGDVLTPYILEELGYDPVFVSQHASPKWLCIGSITKFARPGDTVWGAGIMRQSDPICRGAKWLAVRGPLTGHKTGCQVYGDPALLVPRLFKFPSRLIWGEGVVPHYRDLDMVPKEKFLISPLTADPLNTCWTIAHTEKIASSSLHGIIIAHAFGVPAGWWRPTDRLGGDGSKFADYAASVGVELTPEHDLDRVKYVLPHPREITAAQDRLLNVLHN